MNVLQIEHCFKLNTWFATFIFLKLSRDLREAI